MWFTKYGKIWGGRLCGGQNTEYEEIQNMISETHINIIPALWCHPWEAQLNIFKAAKYSSTAAALPGSGALWNRVNLLFNPGCPNREHSVAWCCFLECTVYCNKMSYGTHCNGRLRQLPPHWAHCCFCCWLWCPLSRRRFGGEGPYCIHWAAHETQNMWCNEIWYHRIKYVNNKFRRWTMQIL